MYLIKSAGETDPRFICNVCEVPVRARLGKLPLPILPVADVLKKEEQAQDAIAARKSGSDDDLVTALLNPKLYDAEGTRKKDTTDTAAKAGERMALLRLQSRELTRGHRVSVVRPLGDVQRNAVEALMQANYFDSLNSQTWSHIAAMLPAKMVPTFSSVNTTMRDLLSGWASLVNFTSARVDAASKRRQVVPGISLATSHVSSDEIISLHFGPAGPSFQIYRFRPKVEPRFEANNLGDKAPRFGVGATLSSDGTFIAVRGKTSADVGKPISYSLFRITRNAAKITGIPFVGTAVSESVRGATETLHRGILYVASVDKQSMCYVLESFDCTDGHLIKRATHPTKYAAAKVAQLVVEARHVYVQCVDDNTETPYIVVSYTTDLIFESAFPLPAHLLSKVKTKSESWCAEHELTSFSLSPGLLLQAPRFVS
jgi:hypothetical protein